MTLATRVSLFFLSALAVILVTFSAALYLLADRHLNDQLDRRVGSALATLTAAVEIMSDCVEWEPHERRLDLPDVRWRVTNPEGKAIDTSIDPVPDEVFGEVAEGALPTHVVDLDGRAWRVIRARISPTGIARPTVGKNRLEAGKHSNLVLTVATPTGPVDTSLRLLLWTLVGLSLTAWSLAALVGRALCRRSLAPVAGMAQSARSIPATEPSRRLKVVPSGDELEDLGRSFNELLDRLQEAFERQRRFTGEASHQLRTPLAVMAGQVEVALRRERSSQEYRRVLQVVAEQSARLNRIVEMLLFMARADAEAATPPLSSLCIRTWLEGHLAEWSSHPRSADLRLAPGGEELWAQAHPPLLAQAVDALLDNAFKHSDPDTPVSLSLGADGGHVCLTVEDAGCGIAPEDQARVFEPFFQSLRLRAKGPGGVGLGLAIARRVVEVMGGKVEVESEPGHGSRFSLRLVRASPPTAEEEGGSDAE